MRYHDITNDNMLNGDGLRVVLWVSGCSHQCSGCHNPDTWDSCSGLEFDKEAEDELFEKLGEDYISGITFTGGDPLFFDNRDEIGRLVKKVKAVYPDKTIWIYTGYDWDDVKELDFLADVDVLVDGKFEESLKSTTLHWRGSANQNVINVKKTLEFGNIVLHCN